MEKKLRVVFATNNENKMKEFRHILRGLDIDVYSMSDLGINIEIEENGNSYEENSKIKVLALSDELYRKGDNTPTIIVADDSGIEIDALNGEPGIYSARYLGEDVSYEDKCSYILRQMTGIPEELRECHYTCCISFKFPGSRKITQKKRYWHGTIGTTMRGTNGFAYDSIMIPNKFNDDNLTVAEMCDSLKNTISHRAKALSVARKAIEAYINYYTISMVKLNTWNSKNVYKKIKGEE